MAVRYSAEGKDGGSVAMRRTGGSGYAIETFLTPLVDGRARDQAPGPRRGFRDRVRRDRSRSCNTPARWSARCRRRGRFDEAEVAGG
jgi:hypothetical protein